MRANRRVKSTGTLTNRYGILGGILVRTTSAAPYTTTQLWLGWMVSYPTLASATRLEKSVVEDHLRLQGLSTR